MIDAAMSTGV